MIELKELSEKLKREKSAALFCHVRPDGDTLGSAAALKTVLEESGVRCDVYCDDFIPEKYFFLKPINEIKKDFGGEYSALVGVDAADVSRLGKFAALFEKHPNTFNIDHHVSNTRFAKYNFVVESASNAENVFNLINAMGAEIDENTANLLALGVLTDTGNFKHKNVTPETFFIAGELKKRGADMNEISYRMFSEQSKNRAALFALVMSKIRYFFDDRFALISVRKENFSFTGAESYETEGFIDFVMGVDTVEVGACLMESEENKFKVSLRSKGSDVNAVAKVFGGGGHTLASGCMISGEYEEVVDKLRYAVKQHLSD